MNVTTVFPVGHYGGHYTVHQEMAGGEAHRDEHLIRVGRRLERLTDDEFGVWMLAHGVAEAGDGTWTRDRICARARETEITDAEACFGRLLERALLTEVPLGTERVDEAVAFATAYRLRTLLVGLGMPPDHPGRHAIGVPGVGTAALLDDRSYRLWQWGTVAPTLWSHCQDRIRPAAGPFSVSSSVSSSANASPASPSPASSESPASSDRSSANPSSPHTGTAALEDLVDPAQVLADVLEELRVLLVYGCAYLDAVPDRQETSAGSGLAAK